jgi:hypothetical protein
VDPRGATRRVDRARNIVGGVAVATFIVHVLESVRMRGPIIQADEGAYLGNARYIAQGIGRTHIGYSAGYSLLLAPPAFISHDPLTAYHLSLVVNALLAASVPLLGYFLARRVLPDASTAALVGAALVLVVYPGWSALANLTLSENALIPAVLATACVIAVAGQSLPRWCLAGAIASYTSWVSPRGVIVVASFTFACVVSTRAWRSSFPGGPAILVAIVLTVAGRMLNVAVAGTTRISGVSDGTGIQVFHALFHPHLWAATVANLLGRIIYTSTATLGLAVFGAVVLTIALLGRRIPAASKALVPVAAFAAPAFILTLLLSATSAVEIPVADQGYFIYGRYVDGVLGPVLVIGAAWLFGNARVIRRSHELVRAIALGAALLVAVPLFALLRPRTFPRAPLNIANVLALRVYILHLHRSLPVVLLATVAVMTVALVLMVLDRRVGAAAMILFLSWSSWIVYNGYEVADSVGRARQRVLLEAFDRLRKIGVDASCVEVDNAPKPPGWHLANYKFLLPTSDFQPIDTAPADCGPLLLSASPQVAARFDSARPVSYENYVPLGLWVVVARVPAPVRNRLATSGLLGPVPVTAALPAAAYRSSLTLVARKATTTQLRLAVQLTHAGSGAPWPGSLSYVQPGRIGTVRLVITLDDRAGRARVAYTCPIPRTMLPDDRVYIDCVVPLVPIHVRGPVLSPGPYTVRVELEQLGVTKFAAKGDRAATLAVTLRS